MSTTIDKHQALIDVAIQVTGDASALFELANANGLSITDEPAAGSSLNDVAVINPTTLQFLRQRRIKSVTIIPKDDDLTGEGIDFWGIEFDFIIN